LVKWWLGWQVFGWLDAWLVGWSSGYNWLAGWSVAWRLFMSQHQQRNDSTKPVC